MKSATRRQRRQLSTQQRYNEAGNDVRTQRAMKGQPSERVKCWWNFDDNVDVTRLDTMSTSTNCGQRDAHDGAPYNERRMTNDDGPPWRSTINSSSPIESWKTL
ncbi:unnamed protein product [Phytophthora fragariaefolia]|uniref:Unnamed protein product n=1 Tax=Phytophthora fragariaefolia TaxID=1490495 RepID=A0A9W7D2F4_9STRA|nr:unnamed protein product [Phytophthora fragariaefolia]